MPYQIDKQNGKWVVRKKDSGEVLGRHATRESAQNQVAAVYANEGKSASTKKPFGIPSDIFDSLDQVYSGIFGALYDRLSEAGQRFETWARRDAVNDNPALTFEQNQALRVAAKLIRSAWGDLSLLRGMRQDREMRTDKVWAVYHNIQVYTQSVGKALQKVNQALTVVDGSSIPGKWWNASGAAAMYNFVRNSAGVLNRNKGILQQCLSRMKQLEYSRGQETPGVLHTEKLSMKPQPKKTAKPAKPSVKGDSAKIFGLGKNPIEQRLGNGGIVRPGQSQFPDKVQRDKIQKEYKLLYQENEWLALTIAQALNAAIDNAEQAEQAAPGNTLGMVISGLNNMRMALGKIWDKNKANLQALERELASKSAYAKSNPFGRKSAVKLFGPARNNTTTLRQQWAQINKENQHLYNLWHTNIVGLWNELGKVEAVAPIKRKYTQVFMIAQTIQKEAVAAYKRNEQRLKEIANQIQHMSG